MSNLNRSEFGPGGRLKSLPPKMYAESPTTLILCPDRLDGASPAAFWLDHIISAGRCIVILFLFPQRGAYNTQQLSEFVFIKHWVTLQNSSNTSK